MDFLLATDHETEREWRDETGNYRIRWRANVGGVEVRPAYYALVKSVASPGDTPFWSFCGAKRPYRTFESAAKAAGKNQRLWRRFSRIAASRRPGRADKLRELDRKAVVGKGAKGHRVMSTLPTWVLEVAPISAVRALFPARRSAA